jgi:hypothetical protein
MDMDKRNSGLVCCVAMKRVLASLLFLVAFVLGTASKCQVSPNVDRNGVERYLRRYYVWPKGTVTVEISPLARAEVRGIYKLTVTARFKDPPDKKVSIPLLDFRADGQYIFEDAPLNLNKGPFDDVRIDLAGQPATGAEKPTVTVVEFTDYQCPFCQKLAPLLRAKLLQDFPDEVRLVMKDMPLDMHSWAYQAALAGQCIYRQSPRVLLGLPRLGLRSANQSQEC